MATDLPINRIATIERESLVRLCAHLTGNSHIAEDLVQETLLEAWRHEQDLRDPDRRMQWVSGIARNVCLRWLRKQGRERHLVERLTADRDVDVPDDVDLEQELEGSELARLLDRALELLPPQTRAVLIGRYIDDLSTSEIASRMGVQPGIVAVRLHRGKLAMRRILTAELRNEATAYGLGPTDGDGFQETSIWCFLCGQRRLTAHLDAEADELILKCEACCREPGSYVTHSRLVGVFGGVARYRAALSRVTKFLYHYNWRALTEGVAPCLGCGQLMAVSSACSGDDPPLVRGEHGVFTRCVSCGAINQSPLRYMVLGMPQLQRFWRDHPRLRLLPERETGVDGEPALLIRAESVSGADALDVVCAADTYHVLSVSSSRAR